VVCCLKCVKGYVRQPRTFGEFITAFLQSEDYTALLKENEQEVLRVDRMLTTEKAREILFTTKLNSYLVGRDPRIVYTAARIAGMRAVLPFSAVNMLHFFRHLELSLLDVFLPKRFIHYYLKELIGVKAYRSLYLKRLPGNPKDLSFRQWQKVLITKTQFGKALMDETIDMRERGWNSLIDPLNLQHLLSLYWLKRVIMKLREYGVIIK